MYLYSVNEPRNPTFQDPYHSSVPLTRLVDVFAPRPESMSNLHHSLQARLRDVDLRHAVVVTGTAGTGKTQLVLSYLQQHKNDFSTIVWLDAGDANSFASCCERICMDLRLIDSQAPTKPWRGMVTQQIPAVPKLLSWLYNRPRSDRWLAVLDNADEHSWGIRELIPRGLAGTLIVTCRDRGLHVAKSLSLVMEMMTAQEAHDLLIRTAFPNSVDPSTDLIDQCNRLSCLVEHHPLALHLAAVTIREDCLLRHGSSPSEVSAAGVVEDYISRFRRSKTLVLQSQEAAAQYLPYKDSLWTAWDTSFRHLETHHAGASPMALLIFLAFLEPTTSMHRLLQQSFLGLALDADGHASRLSTWLCRLLTGSDVINKQDHQGQWNEDRYYEAVKSLWRFGLIRMKLDRYCPREPPMLPKLVRWRARKDGSLEDFQRQQTVLLELTLLSRDCSNEDRLMRINELAELYCDIGAWPLAESHLRSLLEDQISSYGRRDATTICSLDKLVELLIQQESKEKAELEVYKFVTSDPDSIGVMRALPQHLAWVLRNFFHGQNRRFSLTGLVGVKGSRHSSRVPDSIIISHEDEALALHPAPTQTKVELPWDADSPSSNLHRQLEKRLASGQQKTIAGSARCPCFNDFLQAFSSGSPDTLDAFTNWIDDCSVHYRDPIRQRTILHWMAERGYLEIARQCLEKGSDFHAQDRYGATPLHLAAKNGCAGIVRLLIGFGADTAATDKKGRKPIQCARDQVHRATLSDGSRLEDALRKVIDTLKAAEIAKGGFLEVDVNRRSSSATSQTPDTASEAANTPHRTANASEAITSDSTYSQRYLSPSPYRKGSSQSRSRSVSNSQETKGSVGETAAARRDEVTSTKSKTTQRSDSRGRTRARSTSANVKDGSNEDTRNRNRAESTNDSGAAINTNKNHRHASSSNKRQGHSSSDGKATAPRGKGHQSTSAHARVKKKQHQSPKSESEHKHDKTQERMKEPLRSSSSRSPKTTSAPKDTSQGHSDYNSNKDPELQSEDSGNAALKSEPKGQVKADSKKGLLGDVSPQTDASSTKEQRYYVYRERSFSQPTTESRRNSSPHQPMRRSSSTKSNTSNQSSSTRKRDVEEKPANEDVNLLKESVTRRAESVDARNKHRKRRHSNNSTRAGASSGGGSRSPLGRFERLFVGQSEIVPGRWRPRSKSDTRPSRPGFRL